MQAPEIRRQVGEAAPAEVQHLQGVGEAEDLVRHLREPVGQAQLARAGEIAAPEGGERFGPVQPLSPA